MNKIFGILIVLLATGCASTTGYRPTVDYYGDPRAAYLQHDDFECRQISEQNAGAGKEALVNGGTGALLGAGAGAVAGAFLGNPGMGAAVGASAGALSGVTKGALEGDDRYKRIYRNCMRNRGHRVLD